MKSVWLRQQGNENALVFFNGWGMDERVLQPLLDASPSEELRADVLVCHDYQTLELSADVVAALHKYRELTVIAWSFGVWVAPYIPLPNVVKSLAINGTQHPLSAQKGIAPELVHATCVSWSDENRTRFHRRMCGSNDIYKHFSAMLPDRSVSDQQAELVAFQQHVQTAPPFHPSRRYSHAIIGGRDAIFPAEQQYAAWKGVAQTIIADMPHYPFFHFSSLSEIVACLG